MPASVPSTETLPLGPPAQPTVNATRVATQKPRMGLVIMKAIRLYFAYK
jgi:hypothetical protein